jgi:hypothetical protein
MLGRTNDTAAILREFGVELQGEGALRPLEFTDMDKAESAYIHHSRMPVALAAFAAISPAFARGRFPKVRLVDLVAKRPAMDENEAVALAEIGGVEVKPPFWSNRGPFCDHLSDICNRHHLWHPQHKGAGAFYLERDRPKTLEHFRPLGYNGEADLKQFRRVIKDMTEAQRILAATIITLYRSDASDKTWLGRWSNWHAADALQIIRADATLCADWHKLVALYPGW